MKVERIYCDICGEEMSNERMKDSIKTQVLVYGYGHHSLAEKGYELDICIYCQRAIGIVSKEFAKNKFPKDQDVIDAIRNEIPQIYKRAKGQK